MLILIVAVATIAVSTAIAMWLSRFDNLHIPSLGTLRTTGVEAYGGDINLTQDGEQYIDWGTIYTGMLVNRSFYIRSKTNVETTLNFTIANLTFLDSNGENVTEYLPIEMPLIPDWNCTDTPISPDQEICVNFTLQASIDTSFINYLLVYEVTGFSFDMIIRVIE
ncbi:MAG: hypothetical protein OEY22_11135 [Candidatus Bathyarchaeota archaeon]|nr:hypothetical protein [Candidatus Bathyarchaeota archaeon]